MKAEVDEVLRTGDTVGGVFEVIAHGVPPGLGTYANWDERLDGLLAQAVMSLQAVKAVELGDAITVAAGVGSKAQDEIGFAVHRQQTISNQQLVSRAAPIMPAASKAESPTVKISSSADT